MFCGLCKSLREIDFFLINEKNEYKCEVKLMGKGNPEGADAVIARNSAVFIADKLSDQNKTQLAQRNVEWVELRNDNGFKRFKNVLETLNIPHKDINNKTFDVDIDEIFTEINLHLELKI